MDKILEKYLLVLSWLFKKLINNNNILICINKKKIESQINEIKLWYSISLKE